MELPMSNKIRKPKRTKTERFDIDDFEPIRLETDEDDDGEIEQVHVFSIGDNDYYMPTQVPFSHSIKSMEILAREGEAAASAYQLRTTLGDEGYEALLGFEGLKKEDFDKILALANKIILAGKDPR